jgi:hypothetical protein
MGANMDTPEDDEDRQWEELATAEFLKGYAESDAIYHYLCERPLEDSQRLSAEQSRSNDEGC